MRLAEADSFTGFVGIFTQRVLTSKEAARSGRGYQFYDAWIQYKVDGEVQGEYKGRFFTAGSVQPDTRLYCKTLYEECCLIDEYDTLDTFAEFMGKETDEPHLEEDFHKLLAQHIDVVHLVCGLDNMEILVDETIQYKTEIRRVI